ncbi:uncharacterized protein NEMAJ01_1760 [Nematocida major]|uniref:uncharacterized protein n=1 Tax=Nematocida major TaxID=1912982 RepID=UPI002008E9D7|nr:uncharacterized protein NEMAJ01_1760 [Nematocida major]KAH9386864.1 hypothetical protein NEMAJ01_1760 [Nematocida major]
MKTQSIAETLKRAEALQKEKESENNWSKMDSALEALSSVKKKEDAQKMVKILPLMCTAIQSNRSKLSGTGCKCMINLFELMGEALHENLPSIFPSLVSALGKTNRVIFTRALNTASTIAEKCSVKSIARHIRMGIGSHSKTVRQGLLEMAIRGVERERIKELVEVLEISVEDINPEVRYRAKEGMALISEMDRKAIAKATNKMAEQSRAREEKTEEEKNEEKITPSVLSTVEVSPNPGKLLLKSSGANVIVRGPIRSFATAIQMERSPSSMLKPGHSLERIGLRLEKHQKEIEEGLKKEWTPRKTPIVKKRQRPSMGTPVSIKKTGSYASACENQGEENHDSFNVSEEIGNLSISRTEETEHIVENKEMHDSIFSSKEMRGTRGFIESCEAAAEASDSEYSILAPDVLIKRSTTKKI